MRWLAAWRLPLRLAWREARRAPLRGALVLVMIALPVLAVTVADTVYSTSKLDGAQGVERRLGAAEVRVQLGSSSPVLQLPDPDRGSIQPGADGTEEPATLAQVRRVVGEVPVVEVRHDSLRFVTDAGVGDADVLLTDLGSPLTAGLVELSAGRWPQTPHEVVVNAALVERGPELGEDLALDDGSSVPDRRHRRVGDHVEPADGRRPPRCGGVVRRGLAHLPARWRPGLVGRGRRAQRDRCHRALACGAGRPAADVRARPRIRELLSVADRTGLTVLALVVVMVLIEVVLLAGPAFAVGARRQARTLALMAAAGGSPGDARRVVLGSGVVLGLLGSVLGLLLGLGLARALMPVFQGFSDAGFGPVRRRRAAPGGRRRLRAAQRAARRRGAGLHGLAPGRGGGARRTPGRRPTFPSVARARARPRRGRRGGGGVRRQGRGAGRAASSRGRPSSWCSAWSWWCRSWSSRWRRWPDGCRCRYGSPPATRPATAPAPCPRSPRWPPPSPASSRSASRPAATRRRTAPPTCRRPRPGTRLRLPRQRSGPRLRHRPRRARPRAAASPGARRASAYRRRARAAVAGRPGAGARTGPCSPAGTPAPGGDVLVSASSLPPTLQGLTASPAQVARAERTLAEGGAVPAQRHRGRPRRGAAGGAHAGR